MKFLTLLLCGVAIFSMKVSACSCRTPAPEQLYSQSAKIMVGRVVKLEIIKDESGSEFQEVTFVSSQKIKGTEALQFNSYLNGTSCHGNMFDLGEEHIVFLNEKDWTTGYCGGTTRIYKPSFGTKELIEALNKISTNKSLKQDK